MNWANRLTLSRLFLTMLFVAALNSQWQYGRTCALLIFLIAGVTDFIDGEIARRYEWVTNFGKLMDPLVDKIMIAAAFISLVPLKAIPAWAATCVSSLELGAAFAHSTCGISSSQSRDVLRSRQSDGKAPGSAQRTKSEPKAVSHDGYNDPDPGHFEPGCPPGANRD